METDGLRFGGSEADDLSVGHLRPKWFPYSRWHHQRLDGGRSRWATTLWRSIVSDQGVLPIKKLWRQKLVQSLDQIIDRLEISTEGTIKDSTGDTVESIWADLPSGILLEGDSERAECIWLCHQQLELFKIKCVDWLSKVEVIAENIRFHWEEGHEKVRNKFPAHQKCSSNNWWHFEAIHSYSATPIRGRQTKWHKQLQKWQRDNQEFFNTTL